MLHREVSYTNLISGPGVVETSTPDSIRIPVNLEDEDHVSTPLSSNVNSVLPDFIQTIGSNISPQHLEFLYHKGALKIPGSALRNGLVCCFAEFVYPTMPVVDLGDFLRALDFSGNVDSSDAASIPDKSRPKIGIFLFQAVMFAAVAFVDLELLKNAGFTSRRAARKILYQRAKV